MDKNKIGNSNSFNIFLSSKNGKTVFDQFKGKLFFVVSLQILLLNKLKKTSFHLNMLNKKQVFAHFRVLVKISEALRQVNKQYFKEKY